MMFAQANSEHCRHKIFNASWVIDGVPKDERLFGMIKSTTEAKPRRRDFRLLGQRGRHRRLEDATDSCPMPADSREYVFDEEPVHILMKVETHNHPDRDLARSRARRPAPAARFATRGQRVSAPNQKQD